MEGMPIYYIYFWVQVRLKTWFFRRGAHGFALECETGSRGPTIYMHLRPHVGAFPEYTKQSGTKTKWLLWDPPSPGAELHSDVVS